MLILASDLKKKKKKQSFYVIVPQLLVAVISLSGTRSADYLESIQSCFVKVPSERADACITAAVAPKMMLMKEVAISPLMRHKLSCM